MLVYVLLDTAMEEGAALIGIYARLDDAKAAGQVAAEARQQMLRRPGVPTVAWHSTGPQWECYGEYGEYSIQLEEVR